MINYIFAKSIKMVLIVFFIILVVCIFIYDKSFRKERRIRKYSIDSLKISYPSLFDSICNIYIGIVKSLRKVFRKMFKWLEKKYIKYEKDDYPAIDIVINKFFLGFLGIVLIFCGQVFQDKLPSLLEIILSFLGGFYVLDIVYLYRCHLIKKEIENELLRAIIIMNNAFKAGKSTLQAVEIAGRELPGTISDEFKRMHKEMKYGLSVDAVFDRFAKRIDLEEAKYVASSLTILNKTGGNIVKVFDSIERTLYERKKLEEEKKNLTAGSNLVIKILLVVPIFFVVSIYLLSPSYFNPLFESAIGYILIGIVVVMFIIYLIVLEKIVKVKV